MSQIYRSTNGDPAVATTYNADSGSAVPAANILIVSADDTTANNNNGLQTAAGAGEGLNANEVQVQLTNRIQGSGTTSNANTTDLITLPLGATPGTYSFIVNLCAFDSATPASASYKLFFGFRTDGATATLIDDVDRINHEEAALSAANATAVASGNNAVVRVTGVAGIDPLNWNAVGYYVFQS